MPAIIVTDDTFEQEVLKSELPVLVDFFGKRCAPCKAMAPTLDEIAEDLRGIVKIAKMDVHDSPNVSDTYGVRSLPTLVMFKDGKPATLHVGALVQKAKLAEWINAAVGVTEPAPAPRVVEFKLANGMHVVVIAKPGTARVVHQIFYKVGTEDDPEGCPGAANLLGILMSKRAEATTGRADTSQTFGDVTFFTQYVSDTLKSAMEREASRMAEPSLSEEEISAAWQQSAVYDSDDHPRTRLARKMNGMAPQGSASHPLAPLSREEIVRFHKRYYVPNNAVLAVSGDVDPDEVKQLAKDVYGAIPAHPDFGARPRRSAQQSRLTGRRCIEADGNVKQAQFVRNFVVPGYATALPGEAEALEVLTTILSRSGPLERKLIQEGQLATSVRAFYWSFGAGPGQISITVVQGNGNPEKLEAAVDQFIEAIRTDGVSEATLARAKEVLDAVRRVEEEREGMLTRRYGWSVAAGCRVADVNGWSAALAKLTTEDIRRVAEKYLDPRRAVTGWLLPDPAAAEANGSLAKAG